jgi:hypothetical protein
VDFIWRNGILTGGAMSSLYHSDEHPKDYDVYLKDDKALLEFKEICKKYQDEIAVYDTKYSEQNVGNKVITTWATTFKHDIQVITHGNAEVQRPEFDFIHCMPWYDIIKTNLYVSREQYDCIRDKILVKNPNYNLSLSNKRISKYTDRGWRFKQKE